MSTSDAPPEEFDDYVIGRELDRGALGRVYVAEDVVLARPVAIKFISHVAPDLGARQRFLLEARAAARIHHPNVVAIYRVGELADRPYIVSELIRGGSLAKLDKPVPAPQALELALGIARGLAAAHRESVVHCDLKPANVMLDRDGVAKLIDFGLARVGDRGAAQGAPVGTPDYLAPEVWAGAAPTRRSDVYSFGALVYELLAGAPPFAARPADQLRAAVTSEDAPPLPDSVDRELAGVIARCLARDPDARYASGDELREALDQLHPSRRHAAPPGENPYRGLLAFDAAHRGVFFGRAAEIDGAIERLRGAGAVVVTGDSGVGKSSLCRAGVVPAVLDGALGDGRTWSAITIVPGRRPLRALETALDDPGLAARLLADPESLPRVLHPRERDRGLLVFVDQFEELVTLGEPDEVAAFDAGLALVVAGVPGVRVLASVRADFLSRVASLPQLGGELSRLLMFLRPMPRERLRDVIAGPAAATGVAFESPDIVAELVDATAAAGSGGLPLLSFALAELWEARERQAGRAVITRAAVAEMGGVAGALSRHADVVVDGMTAAQRTHACRILTRLVTSLGTRARRTAAELALDGDPDAAQALDLMIRGRLVVAHDADDPDDAATYELAHEVLVTGWRTLREWLDADVAGRATRERLAAATREWLRLGRPVDATWSGARLAEARALDGITADESAFVAASLRAVRRARWWRRGIAIGVIAAVAVAVLLQRAVSRREVERDVTAGRTRVDASLSRARIRAAEADRMRELAFRLFDLPEFSALAEPVYAAALATDELANSEYRDATAAADQTYARDPSSKLLRALLGDLLLARALRAELAHDLALRDEMIARLESFDDDGSRRRTWNQPGTLTIVHPPAAQVELVSRPGQPIPSTLPAGSYLVVVSAPGRVVARAPFVMPRGGRVDLVIDPPPLASAPPGMVWIPPGDFLVGIADEANRVAFYDSTPLRKRSTGAYWIGLREVTIQEYVEFLDAVPEKKRILLTPEKLLTHSAEGWRILLDLGSLTLSAAWGEDVTYGPRKKNRVQDWRMFPVIGLSAENAMAYAAWLDRSGELPGARLCTELEWERAARGADGRLYPHDWRELMAAEANFDLTYSRAAKGPDEVGLHPASNSPFGLQDTTGNAFELAVRSDGGFVLRGGSYWHDRKTNVLPNRSESQAKERFDTAGFRLCKTP